MFSTRSSLAFLLVLAAPLLHAQTFEVASIRPSHEAPGCYSMLPPGGTHYTVTCVPLRALIGQAWKVHPDNVQGGDAQVLDTLYDISAVIPDGQSWSLASIQPMLQQLLIDRFHVAAHAGTKQVSGYAMLVAKDGLKLKPAKVAAFQLGQKAGVPFENSILPGYIRIRGLELKSIASILAIPAQNTVVDGTNIPGVFDMDLRYAKDDSSDSNWPPFMVALEEQAGLKLQSQKVTVNTLVIDHINSAPTPN